MRQSLATAARLLAVPTAALVAVLVLLPGRLPVAVRIYALVACAIGLGVLLAALRGAYPTVRPLRPDVSPLSPSARPTVLARLENEVILGVASDFDLRIRLAPRLRSLAAGLLASRRRLTLEGSPEVARRIFGAETWELLESEGSTPTDRQARGIPPDALARVVDSLERI